MKLLRLQPFAFLVFGAVLSAFGVPLVLAEVTRTRHLVVGGVRWMTPWCIGIPLPRQTVWILFGLISALFYLIPATIAAVVLRRESRERRNVAALLVLLGSLAVSLAVLGRLLLR